MENIHSRIHPDFKVAAVRMALATSVCAAFLCSESRIYAQESVRSSLAGSAAAAARVSRQERPNYNLKLGPVTFDLRGDVGIEYNDNVYLTDSGRESDFILRPTLSLNAFWQATKFNALSFDLGLSYAKYLDHNELDTSTILVAPGSQLAFDIFVGDFRINLHDRFSVAQDPITDITLSNVGDFTRFENTSGISVLWDLNDVVLAAGYDFYIFRKVSGDFAFLDRSEHQFSFSAGFRLGDSTLVGIDLGSAIVNYDSDLNNDAVSYTIGAFWEQQISDYLRFRATAGYQALDFDSGGLNGDTDDASSPYGVLTLNHRLNRYFSHSISGGYETRLGLTTNFTEIAFVRYEAGWQVNRLINLRFNSFYEDSHESSGLGPEDAWRVGVGGGVDFQLTKKASIGVSYDFVLKDSDLAGQDYRQNRVAFRCSYDF